jgi:hypothetical protein
LGQASITESCDRRGQTCSRYATDALEFMNHRMIFGDVIAEQHRITSRRRTHSLAIALEQPLYQRVGMLGNGIHGIPRYGKPSARRDVPAILTAMVNKLPLHHEDVGTAIQAVIAPRPVPFGKRVFWRLVLWVLQTSVGRALIAHRYGTHQRS